MLCVEESLVEIFLGGAHDILFFLKTHCPYSEMFCS